MNRTAIPALLTLALLALAGCASDAPRGAAIERMTPAQLAALQPAANPAVPLDEVVALSRAGTSPAAIIKRLGETHTLHVLSAQQIVELGRQGVDQSVIDYMVDAQEKARRARLLTELADRDAAQAKQLRQERRRADAHYHYGPYWPGYPGPGLGWGGGIYPRYPYGYWRWR